MRKAKDRYVSTIDKIYSHGLQEDEDLGDEVLIEGCRHLSPISPQISATKK